MAPLWVDTAPPEQARDWLTQCCGSARWVERMLARRPFGSLDVLLEAARGEWGALAPDDWRDAFAHHPKIGDRETLERKFAPTRQLSRDEQSGVNAAPDEILAALVEANAAYERRFGYIFIVCATGRSAAEMLAILQARLDNDPDVEIGIAAREQARITELRLRRGTESPSGVPDR